MNFLDTKMQLHKHCIYHAIYSLVVICVGFFFGISSAEMQKGTLKKSATKPIFLLSVKANQELFGDRDYNENLLKKTHNNFNNIPVLLIVNGGIENATVLNESIILSLFLFLLPTKNSSLLSIVCFS